MWGGCVGGEQGVGGEGVWVGNRVRVGNRVWGRVCGWGTG